MPNVVLPIANGAYLSDSLPLSAQECTNWYPNLPQTQALNQETLLGTPGLALVDTTGELNQVNRAGHEMAGVPYFVNGGGLYRIDRVLTAGIESFTALKVGVVEGSSRVSMSDNGTQLCILIPGGKGYIYVYGNPGTFTEITDADFRVNGEPQFVVFLDGYFVFTTDSKKIIISALNDGLSYNALDFGTAEADPDDIVAPVVFRNQLFIAGSQTIESFQNIGGADFPFQRSDVFIQKGVDAAFSLVNANETFMFIGSSENESPAIWALKGSTVEKVSTTAIDSVLYRFTEAELTEAFAWTYAQNGAYFVGFSLPSTTVVIDTVTGRWHERKSQVLSVSGVTIMIRNRINSIATAYGRAFAGDSEDGRIGIIDADVYNEYGRAIIRRVATQPFQNNMSPMFVPSIELTMESGVGTHEVPNPTVRMDRSVDGGKTFKDERSRRIGKKGEYGRRTIWRRNGRASRFEIFRFTLSDAVKPVIIQLTADMQG